MATARLKILRFSNIDSNESKLRLLITEASFSIRSRYVISRRIRLLIHSVNFHKIFQVRGLVETLLSVHSNPTIISSLDDEEPAILSMKKAVLTFMSPFHVFSSLTNSCSIFLFLQLRRSKLNAPYENDFLHKKRL